jgi:hypothetical protein
VKILSAIRRWFCRHPEVFANAATGAQLVLAGLHRGNVEVGLVIGCCHCDKRWTSEVYAACPEAFGLRSQDTPAVWPPVRP